MSFAQRSYQQIQGINGRYSIASIGCFITSFSNLESEFGNNIAPDALDNFFRDGKYYVDVDDGIKDDLGWDTITKYDGLTKVTQTVDHGTAQTAGWPPHANAIVRFYYKSSTSGRYTYHFCKVANAGARTIIDSYDGKLKYTPYGEPTGWATYSHEVPAAVSVAPAPPYTVVETYPEGKQIKLNKQPTNLWGMNYVDPGALAPIEVHGKDETWVVTNKVQHRNGYLYYRRGDQIDGFNVLDCDDYVPPAPVYVPPAAPVEVPRAEKYTLIVPVSAFETAAAAWTHNGLAKTLDAGEYFVISKKDNLYNLSTDNQKDKNLWVNTADNVEAVEVPVIVPTPPASTLPPQVTEAITAAADKANQIADEIANPQQWKVCTPLDTDTAGNWVPVKYVSTNSMPLPIRSLDGKTPSTLTLPAHKELDILSTFDGGKYARDVLLSDRHRFYALPMSMLQPVRPEIQETQVYSRLDVNHDGDVRIDDFIDYGSRFLRSGVAVVTSATKVITSKGVGQFIDGFRAATKKRDK